MRRCSSYIISACLLVLVAGCRTQPAQKATTGAREYYGFAVGKLNDSRWSAEPGQRPNTADFGLPPLSRTHTVIASVCCGSIDVKINDIKKLKDWFDARSQQVSGRHELISYVSEVSTYNGHECIVYSQKVWDKAPRNSPTPLVMTFDGFVLLHPDSDRVVLEAYFSERGNEDEIGKGTAELRKEFLESIEIRNIK